MVKKRIAFPVIHNGWAFEVRCTKLIKIIDQYYDIYMFDPSKLRDYINQVDLVYFPTYESLDNDSICDVLGNKPVITTIAGLVKTNLEGSFNIIKKYNNVKAVQVLNNIWYNEYNALKDKFIKFFMIPNGVNTKEFIPGPRPKDRFNVGWVGNEFYRLDVKRIDI